MGTYLPQETTASSDSEQIESSGEPSPQPRIRRLTRWGGMALLALLLVGAGVVAGYVLHQTGLWRPLFGSGPTSSALSSPTIPGDPASLFDAPVETIGDWALVCPPAGRCFLRQRLADGGGETAFIWILQKDEQGTVRSVWQIGQEVNTGPGMAIELGDGRPRTVPFEGCASGVCTARAILAPDYLAQLSAAASVSAFAMAAETQQVVRFRLSAAGIAEALARLQ
jgi:invasion protein IalB